MKTNPKKRELQMEKDVKIDTVFKPSNEVVAREIEGELIIVPLSAGVGDMEDELYTLNETGKAIWDKLDGKRNLKEVIHLLSEEFEEETAQIEKDVTGLIVELLKRKIIIEA